jgi:3-hydroxyisobutyrate dehydrogenase-like beta-hydroxyacid dehydrogenase
MGSALAGVLGRQGCRVVTCLAGRSERTHSAAEALGVIALSGLDDVMAQSSLVVSLVPPAAALMVARAVAEAADRTGVRPLFVDANSVSPATMAAVGATVAAAGLTCVDGAFVGSSAKLGAETTLYLSGPQANQVSSFLGSAIRVKVIGDDLGVASGFKLSFACFNKGLVALFLEVAAAADQMGSRDELIAALRSFYPGSVETAERLLPSYSRHAARRADEMAEAASWMNSLGQPGWMAAATRNVIDQLTKLDWGAEEADEAEKVVERYCRIQREDRRV